MNATSSAEGGRCFASYHSESVETVMPDEPRPSENLAFKAFFCLLFVLAVPPFGERFSGTAKLQKGERPPKGFCYENLATALTAARELYQGPFRIGFLSLTCKLEFFLFCRCDWPFRMPDLQSGRGFFEDFQWLRPDRKPDACTEACTPHQIHFIYLYPHFLASGSMAACH